MNGPEVMDVARDAIVTHRFDRRLDALFERQRASPRRDGGGLASHAIEGGDPQGPVS